MKKSKLKSYYLNFSLIELFVVVAIFAILISLISPALRKSIFQAKTIVCKNNLKNLNIAITNFIGDNDDKYNNADKNELGGFNRQLLKGGYDGRVYTGEFNVKDKGGDAMALNARIKGNQMYECPLNESYTKDGEFIKSPFGPEGHRRTYNYNLGEKKDHNDNKETSGPNDHYTYDVELPSGTFLLVEGVSAHKGMHDKLDKHRSNMGRTGGKYRGAWHTFEQDITLPDNPIAENNYLFCDGSSEIMEWQYANDEYWWPIQKEGKTSPFK